MVRETEISNQFGFRIYELVPMRGVYLLKTDKGNRCLKKVNYGIQKIMYLYKAKEHIIQNGYENVDRYVLSIEGTPYALVNDDIYVVTEWIDGRECDFKKIEDLKKASANLAKFHICARGFIPDENLKVRNDIGKLPTTLEKRVATLNKMYDIARKIKKKTEFDEIYMSNVDFYINLAKDAINFLDKESYYKVCNESIKESVLCHHDYTYHNIIFDSKDSAHIVDFDYCKSEIQIYDVSTLMIKSLKRLNWNVDYAKIILDSYNSIRPISKEEYNILKTLLLFPQRFWRLANRYYYKEAGWNEVSFTKKLNEIIDEREKYMAFLEKMHEIM
ncbi:spore coat-associated protein S [Caloramator quimbayensis]|uniref:Spore coat-associated protein S n=1 Tax=Caloramator quimbayensis TaxID=1147123 RepID=A0A1T4WGK7_9CLOT|nr:CotS family spore coat protein [Caloramator quimbayensis]SKA76337.1 spore coat-associated protein S [Caloramator quimbayensis]